MMRHELWWVGGRCRWCRERSPCASGAASSKAGEVQYGQTRGPFSTFVSAASGGRRPFPRQADVLLAWRGGGALASAPEAHGRSPHRGHPASRAPLRLPGPASRGAFRVRPRDRRGDSGSSRDGPPSTRPAWRKSSATPGRSSLPWRARPFPRSVSVDEWSTLGDRPKQSPNRSAFSRARVGRKPSFPPKIQVARSSPGPKFHRARDPCRLVKAAASA
jgi:hypothetical protein